jgi:hypothetical protein
MQNAADVWPRSRLLSDPPASRQPRSVQSKGAQRTMQTLEQYFQQEDTPSADSPVGRVMLRVVAKYPTLSFEQARDKAHGLLADAAKRKKFTLPAVYSEQELADQKTASAAYWKQRAVQTVQATA